MERIPIANGKTYLKSKSNTASVTDHSSPVFVLSAPGDADTADLLSPFSILRLQSSVKSKHLRYIGGVLWNKDLSISPPNYE